MPRPRKPDPSPSALRSREDDRRKKHGLVLVQIGPDKFEVAEWFAQQIREMIMEKPRTCRG